MANDDELLDAIVEQVQAALEALKHDTTRDSLARGIRDALRSGGPGVETSVEVTGPEVVVLDGGGAGAAPTEKPDLHVVKEGVPTPDDTPLDIHVVRTSRPRTGAPMSRDGRIVVAESQWQTVYRGSRPATYRLTVDAGTLEVALDGELLERVTPGMTIDLEGVLIRVRGTPRANGRYHRLG